MTSSGISLAIIALVVLFWLFMVFRITVFRIIRLRRENNDSERGEQITGTVISSSVMGKGKFRVTRMEVEFPNFARTPVRQEFRFVDSRPEERRYEPGNRVQLAISRQENGKTPTVKLVGGKAVIGKGYLLFSAVLLAFALYGTWFIYKATLAKTGGDLSNTDPLFAGNDAMPVMGLIFLGTLLIQVFIFRVISLSITGKKKTGPKDLKFYGEKTMATILSYADTNVEINNNPMVKFTYSFTDRFGNEHRGEDKMVVGKLDIGRLPELKEKEVFYLPDAPEVSKLTENLKPNAMTGCLNGVLVFETFVFSAILIGMYLDGIL